MYSTYFKPFPQIETNRLILRKIKKSDCRDLYEYCSDPISSRYSDWTPHEDITVTKQFIKSLLKSEHHGEYFMWCIQLKETGKMIGSVSITDIDRNFKVAELGYGVQKAYSGKGYATEAAEAVMEYLFCTVGVQRVFARIVTSNLPSVRLASRLNMECDGLLRKGIYLNDKSYDVYVYAITDDDYNKRIIEEKQEADNSTTAEEIQAAEQNMGPEQNSEEKAEE